MGYVISAWFIGLAIYFGVKVYRIQSRHNRFMRAMDLVDESTHKAATAKTTESYEFYMKQAVERLDNLPR